jgi:hypothetical protein
VHPSASPAPVFLLRRVGERKIQLKTKPTTHPTPNPTQPPPPGSCCSCSSVRASSRPSPGARHCHRTSPSWAVGREYMHMPPGAASAWLACFAAHGVRVLPATQQRNTQHAPNIPQQTTPTNTAWLSHALWFCIIYALQRTVEPNRLVRFVVMRLGYALVRTLAASGAHRPRGSAPRGCGGVGVWGCGGVGVWGLSPKRLCIYSLLSMCGCCPHREQSAHVGASPPLPRSLGCGGGGAPPKGLWPPAEPPTPGVPRVYDCALFSLLSTSRPRPGGGGGGETSDQRGAL